MTVPLERLDARPRHRVQQPHRSVHAAGRHPPLELNEGPDGPELRVSADAELRVDGLDVVSTLEDLESRLSTIEGLCVNDTAVEDDGL